MHRLALAVALQFNGEEREGRREGRGSKQASVEIRGREKGSIIIIIRQCRVQKKHLWRSEGGRDGGGK